MSYKAKYWAVVDALKAKVEEMETAGGLKDVLVAERSTLSDYPVAFLLPVPYEIRPDSVGGLEEHPITVDIIIVSQGYGFETELKNNIDLAADCRDKLYGDRTLGGACVDLSVVRFGPSYELHEGVYMFSNTLRTVCTIYVS